MRTSEKGAYESISAVRGRVVRLVFFNGLALSLLGALAIFDALIKGLSRWLTWEAVPVLISQGLAGIVMLTCGVVLAIGSLGIRRSSRAWTIAVFVAGAVSVGLFAVSLIRQAMQVKATGQANVMSLILTRSCFTTSLRRS